MEQHQQTRFPLLGAHRALPCSRCHPPSLPPAGRFRGLARECTACHVDPHRGRYRATSRSEKPLACQTCHNQRSFQQITHVHQGPIAAVPAHERSSCDSCHQPGERLLVDSLDYSHRLRLLCDMAHDLGQRPFQDSRPHLLVYRARLASACPTRSIRGCELRPADS